MWHRHLDGGSLDILGEMERIDGFGFGLVKFRRSGKC